jgi:hypothetical protein
MTASPNMKSRQHLYELARPVALHEMGHYVLSRALGFRTGFVSVEIMFTGHRGEAEIMLDEPLLTPTDVRSYLRRRIIVLYAGVAAETLPHVGSPDKQVDRQKALKLLEAPGAMDDASKARELLRVLVNLDLPADYVHDEAVHQRMLDSVCQDLWNKACNLVDKNAGLIIDLAANLADRVEEMRKKVSFEACDLEGLDGVKAIELAGNV